MMNARTLAICLSGIVCMTLQLQAQSRSQYRNFALASDLASISHLAGVDSSEAKTIHRRPAVLQDLEWRPSRWAAGSSVASTDPVDKIMFSFYNDHLFRLVVDYDRDRTIGMTDADMTAAISTVYGLPIKRMLGAAKVASDIETESGSAVARWGDTEHAVVLYRTASHRETFRLIMTDPALDDLARKAASQAARLDEREAPQREVTRQKK